MGQCYSVYLNLSYSDCNAVIKEMNDFIDAVQGNGADFSLDHYAAKGIGRDSLTDLVKIFITDRGFEERENGEYVSYFDASYGWESVMTDMFESIAGTLKDGSSMEIYPDSGRDYLVVEDGKAVWKE